MYNPGAFGEDMACAYLRRKGYAILARNYTAARAEIDIIAQTGDCLVFAEVKSSVVEGDAMALRVHAAKRERLRRCAARYLENTGYTGNYRFDVLLIGMEGIQHIEDAEI